MKIGIEMYLKQFEWIERKSQLHQENYNQQFAINNAQMNIWKSRLYLENYNQQFAKNNAQINIMFNIFKINLFRIPLSTEHYHISTEHYHIKSYYIINYLMKNLLIILPFVDKIKLGFYIKLL